MPSTEDESISSPSCGVGRAQAQVRHLERRRRALLDDRRLADVQLVEAAHLHVELHRAPAHAVGDREAAQNRRDAEDDAQRLQRRAGEVLPHLHPGVADALAEGPVEHRRLSAASGSLISPSMISTWRCAMAAIERSCVTMMIVLPWRWRSTKSSSTSWPVFWSSAPVGSSASSRAGLLASARAIATRWRCPPESAAGRTFAFSGMPTRSSSSCARCAPLLARDAGVEHRQLDVADDGRLREQVVLLEDEADLLVADRRELAPGEPFHALAVEGVGSARRLVQAAQDRHERGLAGARRADQRDELAALDLEVDAPQRVDRGAVGAERLCQADWV